MRTLPTQTICELILPTGGGAVMFIPFIYTANVTERIYYVPLHVYVRKPSFTTSTRPFRLNFPRSIFFQTAITIAIFNFMRAGHQNKGRCAERSYPQPAPPYDIAPPIKSHLSLAKIRDMPYHLILCQCTPLEEHFPCISRNIFSVRSPCSSFAVFLTRPGHLTPLMQ